ncbi:MAG: hypothetical protein HY929_03095 [Euryarchaeota archaeon]|nr:hypothetical protein [Euryarchaeota archaeon]
MEELIEREIIQVLKRLERASQGIPPSVLIKNKPERERILQFLTSQELIKPVQLKPRSNRYYITEKGKQLLLQKRSPEELTEQITRGFKNLFERFSNFQESTKKEFEEMWKELNDIRTFIEFLKTKQKENLQIPVEAAVTKEDFLRILKEEYEKLIPDKRLNPAVKIVLLRKSILQRIPTLTRELFDEWLTELHMKQKLQMITGDTNDQNVSELIKGPPGHWFVYLIIPA